MIKASVVEAALTAEDRCDRCSAPARVRATLVTGELLFCGHHSKQVAEALKPKTMSIYDPEGFFNGR